MTIDIEILQFLHYHPLANRAEIMEGLMEAPSDSTMKRLLSAAVKEGNVETVGRGPATKYRLTPQDHVTMPLDLATYFDKDIDERVVQESFNFNLIRKALEDTCTLVNGKDNVFEKALLALVLLSYIQPFVDGNKRTARITSNAILIANGYCPISFRTVDSIDYKKAMLMFYKQNNIAAFKKIFIEQFLFAVKTYFLIIYIGLV